MAKPTVTVLASGGLDSTACLSYYLAVGYAVHALWVDYGQAAALAESAAVARVVAYYGVALRKLHVAGIEWPALPGQLLEFRGRNLTLVSLALNTAAHGAGLIALGIHQGTGFADCSEGFARQAGELLELLSGGRLRLDCPFVHWSKLDVARYAVSQGVPLDLTYSCERGSVPPCKECVKCQDVEMISKALQAESESADGAP